MRRPRFAGLLLGVLVLTVLALAPPAAAAPSKCLIINNALNANYTSLQAAQDAASPGARCGSAAPAPAPPRSPRT